MRLQRIKSDIEKRVNQQLGRSVSPLANVPVPLYLTRAIFARVTFRPQLICFPFF